MGRFLSDSLDFSDHYNKVAISCGHSLNSYLCCHSITHNIFLARILFITIIIFLPIEYLFNKWQLDSSTISQFRTTLLLKNKKEKTLEHGPRKQSCEKNSECLWENFRKNILRLRLHFHQKYEIVLDLSFPATPQCSK